MKNKLTDIGDTIQVIDERLGLNLLTNVISYDYDCILQYTEIEFGNFKQTLSNLMNSINNNTTEIVNENTANLQVILGEELQQAQDKIFGMHLDQVM